MLVFSFLLFLYVGISQESNIATYIHSDLNENGFTFSYKLSNPQPGRKVHWTVVPDSVQEMSVKDIITGENRVGQGCDGIQNEVDEVKHSVNVDCGLQPGQTYRFYIALDGEERQDGDEGVKLRIPESEPQDVNLQQSTFDPMVSISSTPFTLTMSEPALTHMSEGFSTTKSAFGARFTAKPTLKPTLKPTMKPTLKPSSSEPTEIPSNRPSFVPTEPPTFKPTQLPSKLPSNTPTEVPTEIPTDNPATSAPTLLPSEIPSDIPTYQPTGQPTFLPSEVPSEVPSFQPTDLPTLTPTTTASPTLVPTAKPVTTMSPTTPPTASFPSVAPTSLDVGDKVEIVQKGVGPKPGCVIAVPGSSEDNQWTVVLEDDTKGAFLFHLPHAPKMLEPAGCLLDAMDENAPEEPEETTTTTTEAPTTTTVAGTTTTVTTTEELTTTKEGEYLIDPAHHVDPNGNIRNPDDAMFGRNSDLDDLHLERAKAIRSDLLDKVNSLKADMATQGINIYAPGEKQPAGLDSGLTGYVPKIPTDDLKLPGQSMNLESQVNSLPMAQSIPAAPTDNFGANNFGTENNFAPPVGNDFGQVDALTPANRFENAFNSEPTTPQFNSMNPVLVAAGTEGHLNNTAYLYASAALGALLFSTMIFFWKFRRKGGDRYEYNVHLLVEDEEEKF